MMKRIFIAAAIAILVTAGSWSMLAEDEKGGNAEAVIQKALADYKAGKINEAISGLQSAIAEMQKSQQKGLAGFFPKAPEGWEAGEIRSDAVAVGGSGGKGSWIIVTRKYSRKDENSAEMSMTNSPDLVAPQKQLADTYKDGKMIEMMNVNPNVKFTAINKDGWLGWTIISKDADAQASLICGGTWISIRVEKADGKALNDLVNGIDLKALAASQAMQTTRPAK
ncbi:MAG: hypothetical protein HZA50_02545 [Planctomycetes bacterium]|nr:hypothetical protein [Planctomycetota bacterium]